VCTGARPISHLLIDQRSHRQAVEAVCKCPPQADVVSSLAFVVKAIDAVDRGALVVSAEQEEVLWILDLLGGARLIDQKQRSYHNNG